MSELDLTNVRQGVPILRLCEATVRKGQRGGREVLRGLNLEIWPGQQTAILGANGSGKSTLIRLIMQEDRPLAREDEASSVQVFGRDRWDVFALRRLLGIVSSDLHADFTQQIHARPVIGRQAVVSGFFASRGLFPNYTVTPEMWTRAEKALREMEALHLGDKPMAEMSTGEARRVLIARALVADPPALLLDEPTTGLDIVARHRFLETLRGLTHRGKTLILVTHHLHEVLPEIERVVLLQDGRVVQDGPKEEVLAGDNLSFAFGAGLRISRNSAGYYSASLA